MSSSGWWEIQGGHLLMVNFRGINTDERSWVTFYNRHKTTLKEVYKDQTTLTSGWWPLVLERMHAALNLTVARVTGCFLGFDPGQCWHLYPAYPASHDDMSFQCNRTRKAIHDYLIGWGDCPLHDGVAIL